MYIAPNSRLAFTTIARNSQIGLYCFGDGQLEFANSILTESRIGLYIYDRVRVTQHHNLFYKLQNPFETHQRFKLNSRTVLTADPGFVSDTDCRLQENSPAIDVGIDLGIDTDLVGNKRPQHGGFDLGCYESANSAKDDPGSESPVPSLWGVDAGDSMLFSIKNYNQPGSTIKRHGPLYANGQLVRSVQSMAVSRKARAYFVFMAAGGDSPLSTRPVLGMLNMNDLSTKDSNQVSSGGPRVSRPQLIVELNVIGQLGFAGTITGLAFDPSDGKLYATTLKKYLLVIDPLTAKVSSTVALTGLSRYGDSDRADLLARPTDLAFDAGGNLYVRGASFLAQVDKTKGRVIRYITQSKSGALNFQSLAFDHVNGRLLSAEMSSRTLYQLHLESKKVKSLGRLGFPKVTALSFVPGEGVAGGKLRIVEWKEMASERK